MSASSLETVSKSSNFYRAMKLLPKHQREAMYQIYAFCRTVDDIADNPGPELARQISLNSWREKISALYAGRSELDPALAATITQFGLDEADFQAIIDGMEMDLGSQVRFKDGSAIDLYCDRVASAVGRLSTPIFGLSKARGIELAHHLGRALQLTNILRDLDEDAAIGRLYLPLDMLQRAGVDTTNLATALHDSKIDGVCRQIAEQTADYYRKSWEIMAGEAPDVIKAPRLMALAYGEIFRRLQLRGWVAPRARIKLRRWDKLKLLLKARWQR